MHPRLVVPRADRMARRDVACFVAYHHRVHKLDTPLLRRADEKSWFRFSAIALDGVFCDRAFRKMRTVVPAVDVRALFRKLFLKRNLNDFYLRFQKVAACDAGLVGNDDDGYRLCIERIYRIRCSVN